MHSYTINDPCFHHSIINRQEQQQSVAEQIISSMSRHISTNHWATLNSIEHSHQDSWLWMNEELIIYCKLSLHSDTLTSEHHRRFSIFQVDQMKLHSLRYNQSLALYHLLSDDTTMSITIQRQIESNQWVQFSLIFVCTDRLLRRIRRINCW